MKLLFDLTALNWRILNSFQALISRRYPSSINQVVPVDVINLFFESLVQHLVGFVEDEHLDAARAQRPAPDHVKNATWSSTNDVLTVI